MCIRDRATNGLTDIVMNLQLSPTVVIFMMMVIVLFLGSFMDVVAIMMITLPIFIPVVKSLEYNTVWFCVLFLLNLEMAMTTPPFGMSLFVMKGVAPADTKMMDIYTAGLPFLGLDLLVMIMIIFFPPLALWLPRLMS